MKVAICFSGAVSKIGGRFLTPDSLYNDNKYVNIDACYNSTIKHIVNANKDTNFDFFIHCWNVDLENKFIKLYNPKKSLFENSKIYNEEILKKISNKEDFGGVSKSLSMKKSIDLLGENEYDLVMIYRPDILLMKDINFKKYDNNKIYVNGHAESQGDFHFIMSQKNALRFKDLYFSIENGNVHKTHFWIKNYINNFLKEELYMDDIIPGIDQEVLRKIKSTTVDWFKIDDSKILSYGVCSQELEQYLEK